MQLFLISGLSGSGKSVALKVLEDSGHYCVDNLPAELLSTLIDNLQQSGNTRIAVSIDVRSGASVQQLPTHIEHLKQRGMDVRLLFLDAQTDTLVKRFSETRRRHPLSDATSQAGSKQGLTLPECVQRERELLTEIGNIGHHIDTSGLGANALRDRVLDFMSIDRARLTLLFQSFGFKHGIPLDADLVFDARFLPNPFYDQKLRPLSGRDEAVKAMLRADSNVGKFTDDIAAFIQRWLPSYAGDNRAALTIAIGCTGGQHRSVYIAEVLADRLGASQQVLVRHRDMA